MYEKRKRLLTSGNTSACRFQGAIAIATVLRSCFIADGQVASSIRQPLVNQTSALCAPGWTLKGESCYKLTTSELTWSEAREDCRSMSSLLAEVEDAREQDALVDFLNSTESSLFGAWIGLSDQRKVRNWTWGSGRSMTYNNWFDSEPNNKEGSEYCVNVWTKHGARWNDYNCTATFYGVCQKAHCGDGWTATRKSCYRLTDEATREAARVKCQSSHGSLVEINNSNEQEELHDFLKSTDVSWAWIGLRDPQKSRAWKWDSGSESSYTAWIPGEPSNAGGEEYCVDVWKLYNYKWNDVACHFNYTAVCKQHNGSVDANSTISPDTAVIGGGTLLVAVSASVGALVILVIAIYLLQRKPWKKHAFQQVRDVRLETYTHPKLNELVPQQENHLYECCDSAHRTPVGLHEGLASFTFEEEKQYENVTDNTQNNYCHLNVQSLSLTSTYAIPS